METLTTSDGRRAIVFPNRAEMCGSLATVAEADIVAVRTTRDPDRLMVLKDRHGHVPRFCAVDELREAASV